MLNFRLPAIAFQIVLERFPESLVRVVQVGVIHRPFLELGVSLISQFCRFDIQYNFYQYSKYVDVCNQPSFWCLFWKRVPYCLVVKSIACSFLLERTFDCCAMSRACAWDSQTGCIQAATNKDFNASRFAKSKYVCFTTICSDSC